MKFVVIFKAKIKQLDESYISMANKLRLRALSEFNCKKFEAMTENEYEIALSYWNSLKDIQAWHLDTEHQIAQKYGKEQWYSYFSVEICEIHRSYQANL